VEDSLEMQEIPVEGYEKVFKIEDERSKLRAIICLHDLTLGPALGGTRIYPYAHFDAALNDAKRLAQGMTYKSAVAECSWGGGKSVIIADPKKDKTEELLLAFGKAVDKLGGLYICAEDVGCSPEDVTVISKATKYVVGLNHEKSSGNPSYFTAWGVFKGIQAALKRVFGSDSVKDKTVAVQGLGSVGSILANLLFWNGAKLILSDIAMDKANKLAKQYGALTCSPEDIMSVPCDVFSPCALGGGLNSGTIPQLKCKIVAGAANNQLLSDKDGEELMKRGILYAPDFVINAGGLINVTEELTQEGYNPQNSRNKVDKLYEQLLTIFEIAEQNHFSTNQAAKSLSDYRLKYKIGKRNEPPCFHHSM
jgi:leucine dehydrogenase